MKRNTCVTLSLLLCVAVVTADDAPEGLPSAQQADLQYQQQVLEALEGFRATLNDLRRDHHERLEQIRDAAKASGDESEVRRINEMLNAEPQTLQFGLDRTLWKSEHGFFERLHEGHWIEKIPNGDAKLFNEAARTADYVEIAHPSTIVRLYDNRCMVRFPKKEKGFRKFYDGSWSDE